MEITMLNILLFLLFEIILDQEFSVCFAYNEDDQTITLYEFGVQS